MRAAAPPRAPGSRRAASRCRSRDPGRWRCCAGSREGAKARTCAGGGGVRAVGGAAPTWGRSHAPTLSAAASALGAPARGASLRACACGGPELPARARARGRWRPRAYPGGAPETRAPCFRGSSPAHRTLGAQQSQIPRPPAPGRCSPSATRSSSRPGASRGPAPACGRRAEPAPLTCWRRARAPSARETGGHRRKLSVEFRP